jgi:uncharacterized protein YecT (DUF1311 family)
MKLRSLASPAFGAAVLLLFATSAAALPNGYQCKDNGLQQEMDTCAEQAFAAADKQLNKVYQELKASLSKSQQKALIKDERTWLASLDATCRKAANDEAEGGSMWPMVFWHCKEDETKARVEVLRRWRP